MSGTASVPTQFAAAVTATGLQLDNNFNTVVAYLNDPTNRNNFAVSSGTGTYAVTISPPPGGYTAGLEITFQAGNTNTAAVALNVNGLGVVNMLNQDSSALTVSQIIANGVYKSVYNGTNFIFQNPNNGISGSLGGAKAWALFTANTTLTATITVLASFGVSSIYRAGTGSFMVTFTQPFSNTNYVAVGCASALGFSVYADNAIRTTASVMIGVTGAGGGAGATSQVNFVIYGT